MIVQSCFTRFMAKKYPALFGTITSPKNVFANYASIGGGGSGGGGGGVTYVFIFYNW